MAKCDANWRTREKRDKVAEKIKRRRLPLSMNEWRKEQKDQTQGKREDRDPGWERGLLVWRKKSQDLKN